MRALPGWHSLVILLAVGALALAWLPTLAFGRLTATGNPAATASEQGATPESRSPGALLQAGTAQTWSTPVDLGRYWFPDIAADGYGNAHLIWSSGSDGFDTVMYAARFPDGTWSNPVDIQASPAINGSEATRPSILVDHNQVLQSTFRDMTIYFSQAPAEGGGDPRNWSEPLPISDGYFSDMAEDADGTLHMVYTDNVPSELCPVCYHLYYIFSTDEGASWSDAVDISRIQSGTAKPQLLIDTLGNLHVVYESGIGGSYGGLMSQATVMYVASYDRGATWGPPHEMDPARGESSDTNSPQARNIAIAEGKDGELVVVWWSIPDDIVYFQRSDDLGRTWTAAQAINGVYGVWGLINSRLDIYSMATDATGVIHLVMAGRASVEQTTIDLQHLTWDGANWMRLAPVYRYDGDSPEWPRIAVGLGNHLHVAWFVRDEESIFRSDAGQYRVYYSGMLLDFEGETPLPTPTAVASITDAALLASSETLTDSVNPLATAIAAMDKKQPTDPLAIQNIRSENDDVVLLLLAAAPALLIVAGVVMLATRLRRRKS